ncbi:CD276 antigen-like isoform X1 [Xyrauchen texanus]|uniref:CD276 antigen-like isoform X1 n=1 Tax=Xyrauchen texanus TaxID=154827 RepID=UPI0022422BCB|nr:CD276 antigen-like isoform X1 [Xyrauchen texanus]
MTSQSSRGVPESISLLTALENRDMSLKLATVFCLCLLLLETSCFNKFEITVPSGSVIGSYSEVLILPCTFPVDSSWDLISTVITWQRGLDVIHSFYYNQDQLDRQNRHYVNRTSLFIQEIAQGNASLKLDKANLQDTGVYTCSVSTNTGSQKKSFGVNIAAFYSEPRLQFSLLTDGVKLLVTSEQGYPTPTLKWQIENSVDITNQTHTDLIQDTQTGLYTVSSWINLTEITNSSLTFILHNKPLGQDIRREIQLYSGQDIKILRKKPFKMPFNHQTNDQFYTKYYKYTLFSQTCRCLQVLYEFFIFFGIPHTTRQISLKYMS